MAGGLQWAPRPPYIRKASGSPVYRKSSPTYLEVPPEASRQPQLKEAPESDPASLHGGTAVLGQGCRVEALP